MSEQNELSNFDDFFGTADVSDILNSKADPIDDGKYRGIIVGSCVKTTQKTLKPMFELRILITSGDTDKFNGYSVWKNAVISTENNVKYIKADLEKLELQLKKFSELINRAHELIGAKVVFVKRTKDGKESIFIIKREGTAAKEEYSKSTGDAMFPGDDDLPF